jgi:hypothetical protein
MIIVIIFKICFGTAFTKAVMKDKENPKEKYIRGNLPLEKQQEIKQKEQEKKKKVKKNLMYLFDKKAKK